MASKRPPSSSVSKPKRPRKSLSLEVKLDIVKRHENGEGPSHIARVLGIAQSTVSTVIKAAPEVIKAGKNTSNLSAKMIPKQREPIMGEMERLLKVFVEDQTRHCIPLSVEVARNKALSIIEDLKMKGWTMKEGSVFNASKGWFERFKHRAGLLKTSQGNEDNMQLDLRCTISEELKPECIFNENPMQLEPECSFYENLMQLEPQCTINVEEEENKVERAGDLDLKSLQKVFNSAEKIMDILTERDPNPDRSGRWTSEFVKCMNIYREMYDSKKKLANQTIISSFFNSATVSAGSSTTFQPFTSTSSDTPTSLPSHDVLPISNSDSE